MNSVWPEICPKLDTYLLNNCPCFEFDPWRYGHPSVSQNELEIYLDFIRKLLINYCDL
jgi:hypothetical protein